MAELSLFYDAVLQDDGTYDRTYTSADWAKYFENIFRNGVMMSVGEALRVTAADSVGMRVVVKAGSASLKGYQYINTSAFAVPIDVASSTQDRTDSIVVRHDLNARQAYVAVKKGNVTVERTPDVFEIQLATVRVPRNSTVITVDLITDKRPDAKVCGYSTPFENVSVSGMEKQYEEMLKQVFNQFKILADEKNRKMEQSLNDMSVLFNDWFKNLKNLLDENQAANLQNQINELTANIELGTINHELKGFPRVRALTWDYGAGVALVGQEPTGAGGGPPITIPVNVEYLSRKSLKVKVSIDYGLITPKYQRIDEYHHRFISGVKTIEIILGGF
ncbi:structural protein [Enterococcus faecalis]|nr:structural protein [Enterococcus faecalis]